MLVLKRNDGQWVDITHRSGDVLRIRVFDIQGGGYGPPGRALMGFDDDAHNFRIDRPDRGLGPNPAPRPPSGPPSGPPEDRLTRGGEAPGAMPDGPRVYWPDDADGRRMDDDGAPPR